METVRKYTYQLSYASAEEGYERTKTSYPVPGDPTTMEEAIESLQSNYTAGTRSPWTACFLHETVSEIISTVNGEGQKVTTTIAIHTEDIYAQYR